MSGEKSLRRKLREDKSVKKSGTLRLGKATCVWKPTGRDEVLKGVTRQRPDKAIQLNDVT